MITCPICNSRIPTDDESHHTGDCQCSRETMARRITCQREITKTATTGIREGYRQAIAESKEAVAPEPVAVTDAMVERAARASDLVLCGRDSWDMMTDMEREYCRARARAALTAALTPAPSEGGKS